jgi:hypothetical protein
VSVQNRLFLGLGDKHITDSTARFGKAGTAESCLADDVGKYMTVKPQSLRTTKNTGLGQLQVATIHSHQECSSWQVTRRQFNM